MALQMLFREAGIEDCIRYRQGPHFQYPLIVGVPLQSFCLRSSSEIKKSALRFLKANFPCETLLGFGILYQILFKQKHRNSKTIFANHGPGNPKISSTRKEPKSEKDWETRRGNQIPPCGFSVIQALDPYHTSATNCTYCTWEVQLYCAGFPCTPFSTLNTATSLLADRNSRQLFAVISRIKLSKPKETQHNHANRHVEIRWFSFESIVYISFLDQLCDFLDQFARERDGIRESGRSCGISSGTESPWVSWWGIASMVQSCNIVMQANPALTAG